MRESFEHITVLRLAKSSFALEIAPPHLDRGGMHPEVALDYSRLNGETAQMILIVVKHPVRPEYAENWTTVVAEFTEATRAEPGNISFEWSRSTDEPNLYVLVEAFKDSDAGAAHVSSDHFKAAIARLPDLLAARPQIIYADIPAENWAPMAEFEER